MAVAWLWIDAAKGVVPLVVPCSSGTFDALWGRLALLAVEAVGSSWTGLGCDVVGYVYVCCRGMSVAAR